MRSSVADGNFKANHLKQKNDGEDVWLINGEGFMTNTTRYEKHIQIAKESKSVGDPIAQFSMLTLRTFRHQLVTGIVPNLTEMLYTTQRIAPESAAMLAQGMVVLCRVPWSTSRRVKGK